MRDIVDDIKKETTTTAQTTISAKSRGKKEKTTEVKTVKKEKGVENYPHRNLARIFIVFSASSNNTRFQVSWVVLLILSFACMSYVKHCVWVTSEAYSSPSIVLAARGPHGSRIIFDDFREAYYWLRQNTAEVRMEENSDRFASFADFRMQK